MRCELEADYRRQGARRPRLAVTAAIAVFLVAGLTPPADALHDQGYICYVCHSLNLAEIRSGSNSIRLDQTVLGSIPTKPTATVLPLPGTGGYPLTCDVCHKSATDVPSTKFANRAKKHPVDLIQTGDNTSNPHEITCNDCHNGPPPGGSADPDLTPVSLSAKNATDGYPDHNNVVPGYSHTLSANPPHLTQPYWSAADNTSFWTGVRNNTQNMICWLCHDGSQQSPFTQVRANANVRAEYTGVGAGKGHAIRTAGGALGAGSALPCYDCHDSHGSVNNALVLDNLSIEGKSVLAVTTYIQATRPYDDLPVCAGCHDTGRSSTAAGSRVEGLDPVDPYDSAKTSSLHRPMIADNMLASTQKCLAPNGGCHGSPHDTAALCDKCHAPGGTGPTVVWPAGNASGKTTAYGSHLSALRSDNLAGLSGSGWNGQCNKCHAGHEGPVGVPTPPASWIDPPGRLTGTNMAVRLGLDAYAVDNGIRLGGTATDNTSEADLCWGCHDAQTPSPVSEWGFNTKTSPPGYPVVLDTAPGNFPTAHDGTGPSVNFGWIYTDNNCTTKTSNWTAGYLLDEYDTLLKRRIVSVHTASFDPAGQSSSVAVNVRASDNSVERTSPTLENKSYIRCSYCHDVHDLNKAQGDAASGRPFLRGSWVSNPYPPELPPRASGTMMNGVAYAYPSGAPRNIVSSQYGRERGGYFIDQNSGWPTDNAAMNSLALTAGICTLCHGTDVDAMKFYTGSRMWLDCTVNGHSNSTLGGTRTNARDLFTGNRDMYGMGYQRYVGGYVGGSYHGQCYQRLGANWGLYGLTCCIVTNDGWYGGVNPPNTGTCTPGGGDYAGWYTDNTIGGAQGPGSMAHKFTCSKCHTPHAAGLPALLVHNCVDTTLATPSNNPRSNASVNCHRKTTTADGWHKLAPGQ